MAGAYRVFAVLIAELSLTLAQLPQELFPGNVQNLNLQLNAPPYPSGFPGYPEGYTEMSPANSLFPSRFGFPAFSDPLIDRRLLPIPSSSTTTSVSHADNHLPIPEIKNDIHDIPGYQTVLDQPIPGVFSEPVQHPYFPNNLGFPSPFGIPGPLGLENPFVTPSIFSNQNVSNQPDVFSLPMPFGLSNTFEVPLQINNQGGYPLKQSPSALHDFNNFPGTISYPPETYAPNETSYESFTLSGRDSEISPKRTGTNFKEGFPNILGIFHNFSPLSRVESETTFKKIPSLDVTTKSFEQTHPGFFPPGFPIESGVNIESRSPFVPNAFSGPMSITSNLPHNFNANPWYISDLATEPFANLQNPVAWTSPPSFVQFPFSKVKNIKENVDKNHENLPPTADMNPKKNIPNVYPNIPGLPFPSDLHFYNEGPMSEDAFYMSPLNSLMTEKRNENKTTSQMMPGLFQLPLLGMPLENYLNGPVNMNRDKNIPTFYPNIPGLPFPSQWDLNNEGPMFEDSLKNFLPFKSLMTEERNDNKTTSQIMPGLFQLPPLGIPLENYLNGPVNMNREQNIPSLYPNIPGIPFPSDLHLYNEGPMSEDAFYMSPLNSLMTKKRNENKTTSQMMPGLFQLPILGMPLENYFNGPVNMNRDKNIPTFYPNIPGLPFPSQLDLNNEGPMFEDSLHNFPPFKRIMTEKRNDNKTTSQIMSGLFQLPPVGIPLENYSPIHPYGIGPWPLFPQGVFEYLDTLTPENGVTPIQVPYTPDNFLNFFPNLPTPFPRFKQPTWSERITPSVTNRVVDSTTTATKPPAAIYITPSTTVVPQTKYVSPTTVTQAITTSSSPSTVAQTTTSPLPSTAAPTTITTFIPSTAAPTTTTTFIPSTAAPTTTTLIPSTVTPPKTTSVSTSTTKSLPPSTEAPPTSTSSTVAPPTTTTATTTPPTTIITLLTSTYNSLSSTATRNTTVSN